MGTKSKYYKALAELQVMEEKLRRSYSPYLFGKVEKLRIKVERLKVEFEGLQVKMEIK